MRTDIGVSLLPQKQKESMVDHLSGLIDRKVGRSGCSTSDQAPTPDMLGKAIMEKLLHLQDFLSGWSVSSVDDLHVFQACILASYSTDQDLPYDCKWMKKNDSIIGYIHFRYNMGKVLIDLPTATEPRLICWLDDTPLFSCVSPIKNLEDEKA